MIRLLHLNKLTQFIILFTALIFNNAFAATAEDIWKKQEKKKEENSRIDKEKEIIIKSPILSGDVNKISITITIAW